MAQLIAHQIGPMGRDSMEQKQITDNAESALPMDEQTIQRNGKNPTMADGFVLVWRSLMKSLCAIKMHTLLLDRVND